MIGIKGHQQRGNRNGWLHVGRPPCYREAIEGGGRQLARDLSIIDKDAQAVRPKHQLPLRVFFDCVNVSLMC